MATADLQVRITAKDEATPVIRRLQRRLWWFIYGDYIVGMLIGAIIFGSGVLLGLLARA